MNKRDLKVVILCGGKGTRLRDVSEILPKPLVPIGEMPILWHIMKGYSSQGYNNFVLCLGYKGDLIRDFFLNYQNHSTDLILNLRDGKIQRPNKEKDIEEWNITFVNTGETTNTALRLHKIKKYLEKDPFFMLTYGDGVSNIIFDDLLDFHINQKTIGTLTGVNPTSKYGEVKTGENNIINSFVQKPVLDDSYINGGFMVFNNKILRHPMLNEDIPIETVLADLTENNQLSMYKHKRFWHCMDTPRDFSSLNEIWESKKVPWRNW